ncbi:MAG TPA: thermonuclease family protein [Zeimonas sp.]
MRERRVARAGDDIGRADVADVHRCLPSFAGRALSQFLPFALALLLALAGTAPAAIARGVAAAPPSAARAAGTPAAPAVAWIEGVVEHVYDGDSFRLRASDGREVGVRIAGIDAPERTQPFANVSRRALRAAIDNLEVRIAAIKADAYGRVVGRVFVNGRDIGLEQLEHGMAWHFARYDADLAPADRERYARAQADARERRTGLWRDNDPVEPWLFRKQRR